VVLVFILNRTPAVMSGTMGTVITRTFRKILWNLDHRRSRRYNNSFVILILCKLFGQFVRMLHKCPIPIGKDPTGCLTMVWIR
jgi:hypothetical protein